MDRVITAKDNAALMMIRGLLLFSSMVYVGVGRYPIFAEKRISKKKSELEIAVYVNF